MFKFKKVASILASTVMLSSTVAFAAATTYPAPFISGGAADVAVVYGAASNNLDLPAVTDIVSGLSAELSKQATGTTTTTITGENSPLFTGSTKIYYNDSLNAVRSVLTKTELPKTLKDGTFSGNVDATYTQMITLGTNPKVTFAKQPTSSDDPAFGLALSTSTGSPVYNATVTFNKAVNFTKSTSQGKDITLFGQKFTVSSATDTSNLVLLKSAEKISLTSENPTATVTIDNNQYTVELVSASTTTATVKVTDSAGNSDSQEITENGAPVKVQGLSIAVTNADSNNLRYSASIIAGAEKVTLASGSAVTTGDDDTSVDGTKVTFTGGVDAMTKMVISVAAPNSDSDAIMPGKEFVDPVFGTFKIDFTSINPAQAGNASTDWETIGIHNNGDDKMEIKMTNYAGDEATHVFAFNSSTALLLAGDDQSRNISVMEHEAVYKDNWVMVGNEEEGHWLQVSQITNASSGYSSDHVKFKDVFSGDTYEATLTGEGAGTVTIGGKVYDLTYTLDSSAAQETGYVRLNYPDSAAAGSTIVYPTIQTSKGANVGFYKPLTLQLDNIDGSGTDMSELKFPDGDGYTAVSVTMSQEGNWTFNPGGLIDTTQANGATSKTFTIGRLTYNVTSTGTANQTKLYLMDPASTASKLTDPAVVIFEGRDDASTYNALVVKLEPGATSDDGIGVDTVSRTWDASSSSLNLASNSKVSKATDRYGEITTLDSSDSDQKTAEIAYPAEQVYALIYGAAADATTSGGGSADLGNPMFKDTEIATVQGKNLIVVGGSCVNTVAAKLIDPTATAPICGDAWTAATTSGDGSYIIQTFNSPYTTGKVATLVAGYSALDTSNAAKYFKTQSVDTTVGKKYKGTTETQAALVTTP